MPLSNFKHRFDFMKNSIIEKIKYYILFTLLHVIIWKLTSFEFAVISILSIILVETILQDNNENDKQIKQ